MVYEKSITEEQQISIIHVAYQMIDRHKGTNINLYWID